MAESNADPQKVAEAAGRALQDPSYAAKILDGSEDYPIVRAAILKDLATAGGQDDVQGYASYVQNQGSAAALQTYIASGPKPGGQTVLTLANLGHVAPVRMCW